MEYLIYFAIIFGVIFTFYYFLFNRIKIKKGKYNKIGEINYLILKFKLDPQKINYKSTSLMVSILDALIIASTCVIIFLIPVALIWQMVIGFVLLFALIYSVYEIYGRSLVRKGWKK